MTHMIYISKRKEKCTFNGAVTVHHTANSQMTIGNIAKCTLLGQGQFLEDLSVQGFSKMTCLQYHKVYFIWCYDSHPNVKLLNDTWSVLEMIFNSKNLFTV